MTEREKIIKAINSVQVYGIMSNASGGDLPVANEMLADALIAAGYGEVEEAKRKAFVYSREIAHLDNKLKETEHRAEVAERALLDICRETTVFPSYLLACALMERRLKKAEKELAEERKDD